MIPPGGDDWSEALTYLQGLGFDHLYPRPAEQTASGSPSPSAGSSVPGADADAGADPEADRKAATEASTAPEASPLPDDVPVRDPLALLPPVGDAGGLQADVRLQRLDETRRIALRCHACRLCEGRHNVVFGSGDPEAELMFVGEGPGAEEDRQGLPFVGAAGQLLTKIIQAIELERDRVYIANMVKCRPPGNRDPQADEVAACRPYLDRQIDLVRPKVIVALGRVAAQALLARDDSLGRMRGQWHDVRGVPTRVTYHPAALLRHAKWKRPTWEDMKLVRDRLQSS